MQNDKPNKRAEMTQEEEELYVRMLALQHASEIPEPVRRMWSQVKIAYDRLVGGVMPPVCHMVVLACSGALSVATSAAASKKGVKAVKTEPESEAEAETETTTGPTPESDDAVAALEKWAEVEPGSEVIFNMNGQYKTGKFIRVLPYGALSIEDDKNRRVDVAPAQVRRKPGRKRKEPQSEGE